MLTQGEIAANGLSVSEVIDRLHRRDLCEWRREEIHICANEIREGEGGVLAQAPSGGEARQQRHDPGGMVGPRQRVVPERGAQVGEVQGDRCPCGWRQVAGTQGRPRDADHC